MVGQEQVTNCGLAVAALEQCGGVDGPENLATGLGSTCWPGRFQRIDGAPPVIVDGAHNPAAIRSLVRNLEQNYRGRSVAILLGMLADKAADEISHLLARAADAVCCVPVKGERGSADPNRMAGLLRAERDSLEVSTAPSPLGGLEILRQKGYDLVVVTGSLYLAGEVLAEIAPPYGIEPDPPTRP